MSLFDSIQPYARRAFIKVKPVVQPILTPRHSTDQKAITFLTGFPRSGTNMVLEVFEWSGKTEVFREGDPRVYGNFQLKENANLVSHVKASPAKHVMVKALLDSHRLKGLMELFPGSGVIWIYRHYDDSVNSIMDLWPGHRNGIDDIVAGGIDAAGWRGANMSADTLAQLRAEYQPEWNDATCNAWFWYLRQQLYYDQGFPENERAILVRYESLVTDPLRVIRPLADLVGVSLTQVMASVPHARSVRKRPSPDIAPAIRERCEAMLARLDATWEAQGI
mgnify:CR=1 FL=1|tara:strand:+ start:1246 stop:2079 length:834 start_codon:yes stop_codon:yes gene_type:complete